jgi:hypothetical protein
MSHLTWAAQGSPPAGGAACPRISLLSTISCTIVAEPKRQTANVSAILIIAKVN